MTSFTLTLNITPQQVLRWLLACIVFLVAASVVADIITAQHPSKSLSKLFGLDEEGSIPTYFASLILLLSAGLLLLIGREKRRRQDAYSRYWYNLALFFLLLSIDEMVSIHEYFTYYLHTHLGGHGASQTSWAIVGMVVVAGVGLLYLRFLLALSSPTRVRMLVAGAVYVLGALGFEYLGGRIINASSDQSLLYQLCYTVEESLEMLGVYLFIRMLLLYMAQELHAAQAPALSPPAGSLDAPRCAAAL
ncbi:hypothetical protein [Hymenobacter glacialis]|uniref:Uncharacterized protein n=1 Tax=Hymenobacter glacialis TaxID=1908236 RepID=A0A1G1SYV0_9BACT|nr:hypothetical protein [Hymenobacter glacialis]OGX83789.1 hypothetical protein BEN48_03205 [Hymenobacter glacialis]